MRLLNSLYRESQWTLQKHTQSEESEEEREKREKEREKKEGEGVNGKELLCV